MLINKINTVDDVKVFFQYLVNNRSLNFNPDEDFSSYISLETGKPSFSTSEIKQYNSMMNDAFEVCQEAGVDIYDLSISCLRPHIS
jgi:hypothetical protein